MSWSVLFLVAAVVAAGCAEGGAPDASDGASEPAEELALTAAGVPLAAPVPGGNFWYGSDIAEALGAVDPGGGLAKNLNDTFAALVRPLQGSFVAFETRPYAPGLKVYQQGKAWDGYTLLTSLGYHSKNGIPYGAILIDMNGNVVNEWPLTGFPAKMLPGGNVLGGVLNPGQGGMTSLVQMDWCGNVVHEWPVPQDLDKFPLGTVWHHDFQRAGNPVGYFAPCQLPSVDPHVGTTWLLTNHVVGPGAGDTSAISKFALFDDAFYEVDANGGLVWAWYAWEHFEQMGFDSKARDGIYSTFVPGGTFNPPSTDWTHMNQLARLGPNKWYQAGDRRFHPDNLIFDTRTSGILGIVARYDHPKGKWKAGEIVWRVGPDYGYGSPGYQVGQIIGPHMTHMIPQGLPGAGNILVFDNGGFSGYGSYLHGLPGTWPVAFRSYSRVVEFDPVTLKVVWEYAYQQDTGNIDTQKFFSTLISGAQRLKNGNTMITQGGSGRIFEVTRSGEIVWEYRSPFKDFVFPGGGGLLGPNAVYRAYRVPKSWVPVKQTCPLPANFKPTLSCD